jgi:hypothetical protein
MSDFRNHRKNTLRSATRETSTVCLISETTVSATPETSILISSQIELYERHLCLVLGTTERVPC